MADERKPPFHWWRGRNLNKNGFVAMVEKYGWENVTIGEPMTTEYFVAMAAYLTDDYHSISKEKAVEVLETFKHDLTVWTGSHEDGTAQRVGTFDEGHGCPLDCC